MALAGHTAPNPCLRGPFALTPWGAGLYAAAGDELYWFFRFDPANPGRRFGTPLFDRADTNVWNLAVLRDGNVQLLGRYESLFSGSVLLSDLRAAADTSLYVAMVWERPGAMDRRSGSGRDRTRGESRTTSPVTTFPAETTCWSTR
jgi:hypothetical protein